MGRVGLLGCVVILIVALIVVGGFFVSVRNNLVGLEESVNQQWAQVESQSQRRYDLIPNLVKTVGAAADFEKSTLEAVVNARSRVGQVQAPAGAPGSAGNVPDDPNRLAQFEAAQGALSSALSRLLVVVERYPELKSNQNFLELQSQLEGTENRIAVERQRYNDRARDFNTAIRRFPASLVASMSGFKQKAYFKGAPGSQQAPEVQFPPFGTATTATQ